MPTADLISLSSLVATDTFNTWLNRTNQLVDTINPLQIYDINVGVGSTYDSAGAGLALYRGYSAGNYNGVGTVGINIGPGVGYATLGGQSRAIQDFSLYSTYGLTLTGGATASLGRVSSYDEYAINDTSDATLGSAGTVKKVAARFMLPPTLDVTSLLINGDVTINGAFSNIGGSSFVILNNLQIESKQVVLGYQQSVSLGLTGVTAGTFNVAGGPTAYYFTTSTGLTPAFYGHAASFTASTAGPTGVFVIGSLFQSPYTPSDIGATGYVGLGSTGTDRKEFYINNGITAAYLSNANADQGGMVLKGSEGDKNFLWTWIDTDTGVFYDGWMSNVNIGVNGSTNSVISRVYRSYGFTGVSQSQFIFAAESTLNPEIYLTNTSNTAVPLQFTGGTWKISRDGSNVLVFGAGPTGIESTTENFKIYSGASGATYPGITVNNFARNLNADLHDGAHAATGSTAYTIPVSDSYGRLDDAWLNASSIRKRYTVASHGFSAGNVLRYDSAGAFAKAIASTPQYAEAIGIVSDVHSANEFTITNIGKISGLSGYSMTVDATGFVPGNVYFLSASVTGSMIADPDDNIATKITSGQVRKPILLATSPTEGYVLSYVGAKVPDATDTVYLSGLVPVGSIYPYAGSLSTLSTEWLLCDGDRYRALDYPELYTTIQTTYRSAITFSATGLTGSISGGSRGLQTGDHVLIGGATADVAAVNVSTGNITFDRSLTAGSYTFNVASNSSGEAIFMLPDLRTRVPIGSSTGSSNYTSVGLSAYTAGDFGGNESIALGLNQIPSHSHIINSQSYAVSTGAGIELFSPGGANEVNSTDSSGGSTRLDLHSPYVVTHYIIRAKASTDATILTGHNHDDRYTKLNNPTTILTLTGAYRNYPATTGVTGYNLYASPSIFGQTAYIMSAYANPGITSPSESTTKVYVNGDFTVFNNGISGGLAGSVTAQFTDAFTVNPIVSAVTIRGNSYNNPSISFVNLSGSSVGASGSIGGLKDPTISHQATNKNYVDNAIAVAVAGITSYSNSNNGIPANVTVTDIYNIVISNLTPGLYTFTAVVTNIGATRLSAYDNVSTLLARTIGYSDNAVSIPHNIICRVSETSVRLSTDGIGHIYYLGVLNLGYARIGN